MKKLLVVFIAIATLSSVASASEDKHSNPAVQGYDVVSYQTEKRPVRGNGHFTASHDGALYLFSSQENLDLFKASPAKYVPAYNGFCAYGVAVGKKFTGDPEVWRVVNGRLFLNLDAEIQDLWFKDTAGQISKADKKWPTIQNKNASEL